MKKIIYLLFFDSKTNLLLHGSKLEFRDYIGDHTKTRFDHGQNTPKIPIHTKFFLFFYFYTYQDEKQTEEVENLRNLT